MYPRDPGSPSENGFMEPKYLVEEVIVHPNHHMRIWLDSYRGKKSLRFQVDSHDFCSWSFTIFKTIVLQRIFPLTNPVWTYGHLFHSLGFFTDIGHVFFRKKHLWIIIFRYLHSRENPWVFLEHVSRNWPEKWETLFGEVGDVIIVIYPFRPLPNTPT